MSTSGGGGYCDCGDVEAWKANHSCEMHQAANAPTYTVSMLLTTGGHDTGELSSVYILVKVVTPVQISNTSVNYMYIHALLPSTTALAGTTVLVLLC